MNSRRKLRSHNRREIHMKKIVLLLTLSASLSAQAKLQDYFDFEKFVGGLMMISDSVNESLEKVRLSQQQHLDVQAQWDLACDAVEVLKVKTDLMATFLVSHKLGQPACLPLVRTLQLQSSIMARCKDYYANPVPSNSDNTIADVILAIQESNTILTECYPIFGELSF
jgi:hypothetical protein